MKNLSNKKIAGKITTIILVLVLLIIIAVVLFFQNKGKAIESEQTMEELIISEEEYSELVESLEYSSEPLSSDIQFDDSVLFYDEEDDTFYYSMIENDENKYNPCVSVNDNKALKFAFWGQVPTSDSVAEGTALDLILYDDKNISVSSLVITSLPIMNIEIDSDTVQELELDETMNIEDDVLMELSLFDNSSDFEDYSDEDSERLTESLGKIRVRGGTTRGADTKGYKIELLKDGSDIDGENKKENLLGLRNDDDWILFAAYSDYEKIRNVFSSNLWSESCGYNNEWQVANGNQYKYIELFFNGRYHGLYALGYPIDSKQVGIDKDSTDECLFKKKDWSASELSLELEFLDSGDGTGNYYLPGYSLKAGTYDGYEVLHNIYYDIAYSDDSELIRDEVDINNAVDIWLFFKLVEGVDNIYDTNVKNIFASVKLTGDEADSYKLLLTPWDLDQTWGNRYVDESSTHGITSYSMSYDYDTPTNWGPVVSLMKLGDSTINSEIKARYQELREGKWSDDYMSELIDDYEMQIYDSGAYVRTMNRWPDANYLEEGIKLSTFKEYVLSRLQWMDEYINNL